MYRYNSLVTVVIVRTYSVTNNVITLMSVFVIKNEYNK